MRTSSRVLCQPPAEKAILLPRSLRLVDTSLLTWKPEPLSTLEISCQCQHLHSLPLQGPIQSKHSCLWPRWIHTKLPLLQAPMQPTHSKSFLPLLAPGLPLHNHPTSCWSHALLLHASELPLLIQQLQAISGLLQTMKFSLSSQLNHISNEILPPFKFIFLGYSPKTLRYYIKFPYIL